MKRTILKLMMVLNVLLSSVCVNAQTETYLRGDANGDGVIDISDVTTLVNIILGKETASSITPTGNACFVQLEPVDEYCYTDVNTATILAKINCYRKLFSKNFSYGFVYGKSPSLSGSVTYKSAGAIRSNSINYIQTTLKELEQNTTYYYQPYLNVDDELYWGTIASFTTKDDGTTPQIETTTIYWGGTNDYGGASHTLIPANFDYINNKSGSQEVVSSYTISNFHPATYCTWVAIPINWRIVSFVDDDRDEWKNSLQTINCSDGQYKICYWDSAANAEVANIFTIIVSK